MAEDAEVPEDDILAILESMKMEIPVTAPADGRVKEIWIQDGGIVAEGELLLFFKRSELEQKPLCDCASGMSLEESWVEMARKGFIGRFQSIVAYDRTKRVPRKTHRPHWK